MYKFVFVVALCLINFTNGINGHAWDTIEDETHVDKFDLKKAISSTAQWLLSRDIENPRYITKKIVNVVVDLLDGLKQRILLNRVDKVEPEHHVSDNVAISCLAMLKAYVRASSTDDRQCIKRYLCEGNKEAVSNDQNDKISHLIAKYGSYLISNYLLDNKSSLKAAKLGRQHGRLISCQDQYRHCYD